MLKEFILVFSFLILSVVGLNGADGEKKSCEEEAEICMPPEEQEKEPPIAYRKHHCPRCNRYCYYWDRDIDATWPSKIEDSFYDYLRN
jgi:hypothetical protein